MKRFTQLLMQQNNKPATSGQSNNNRIQGNTVMITKVPGTHVVHCPKCIQLQVRERTRGWNKFAGLHQPRSPYYRSRGRAGGKGGSTGAVADIKRPRPSKNLAEQDKNSCRGMRLSNLTNGSQILPLVHLWTCRRLKIMGLQDSSVMC